MAELVEVQIQPQAADWTVQLRAQHLRGRAVVSGSALSVLQQRLSELEAVQHHRSVLGPSRLRQKYEVQLSLAEEAVGAALGEVLLVDRTLARHIGYSMGCAEAQGASVVISIEGEDQAIRALPWELLSLQKGAPLETTNQGTVVRLVPGPALRPWEPGIGVRVLLWSPLWTPSRPPLEAPAVSAVCAALSALADAHDRVRLKWIDPLSAPYSPEDGWVDVLHIVTHGTSLGLSQIGIDLGDGVTGNVGSLSHVLSTHLARCALVVLDVCHSGTSEQQPLDGLAGRLLAAGVRAVISPHTTVDARAASAFAAGLYPVLSQGGDLIEALCSGRRRISALHQPHRSMRWYLYQLTLNSPALLSWPPMVPHTWLPPGWPRPSIEAATHLDAIYALAVAQPQPHGFIGAAHFFAFVEQAPLKEVDPALHGLRDKIVGIADWFFEQLRLLRCGSEPLNQWRVTPRVRRWGAQLRDGFTPQQLWEVILSDPTLPARVLLGQTFEGALVPSELVPGTYSTQTLQQIAAASQPGPARTVATALEVIGGPDDGMQIAAGVGLRRWPGPGNACPPGTLYADSLCIDRRLSRNTDNLVLQADGQLQRAERVPLCTSPFGVSNTVPPDRPFTLHAGEVVRLGDWTCLLGISAR